jgi:hypothetical protein
MNYSLLGVLWPPYPSSAYLDRINDGELTSKKKAAELELSDLSRPDDIAAFHLNNGLTAMSR